MPLSWGPVSTADTGLRLLLPILLGGCLVLGACAGPRRTAAPATVVQPATTAVTGIPDCDRYLASYLACHRAAGIFPADQLATRYADMRRSLLDAATDPQARNYVGARCRVLTTQLEQALAGRPCDAPARTPAR